VSEASRRFIEVARLLLAESLAKTLGSVTKFADFVGGPSIFLTLLDGNATDPTGSRTLPPESDTHASACGREIENSVPKPSEIVSEPAETATKPTESVTEPDEAVTPAFLVPAR
jgi:hypothetical protein